MGGREVGGLSNQLAAHMGFEPESVDRVRRFWNAPGIADHEGLKAVDLFDAIAAGRIKALWVMGTNPAVSLPRADAARAGLAKLDLFVVSEVVASNDTIGAGPHVLLPATAWGEKDGTVTNSERRISRQRSFLEPPGEAMPDWWIVSEVAKHLGFARAFDYRYPADIFREHACLSAFENNGTRDFDLSGLSDITPDGYRDLAPVQWPVRGQPNIGQQRLFTDGAFFTPDGRANVISVAKPAMAELPDKHYPLLLNTGRVRDQWHTMTRTGKSPRLGAHVEEPFVEEPFVEVHPEDAAEAGLVDRGFASVSSLHGTVVLRVRFSGDQRRGELFAPIHWNDETASDARVGALVHQACDPYSGQPDLKATPARIAPATFTLQGFLLSRHSISLPKGFWWSRTTIEGGTALRFAANTPGSTLGAQARGLLGEDGAIVEFHDTTHASYQAESYLTDVEKVIFGLGYKY